MKLGCLEASKIMFDFWIFLLLARLLAQFVRVPPYEILVFLTVFIFSPKRDNFMVKRPAALFPNLWLEKVKFFNTNTNCKYVRNRVKDSKKERICLLFPCFLEISKFLRLFRWINTIWAESCSTQVCTWAGGADAGREERVQCRRGFGGRSHRSQLVGVSRVSRVGGKVGVSRWVRRLSGIGQLRGVGWADLARTVEINFGRYSLEIKNLRGGKVFLCASED